MIKLKHWISYIILILKSKLFKKKLIHIGKDYFIYHDRVVEIQWLKVVDILKYRSTVQFLADKKFYINWKTVVDVDNGIEVLYHDVELRKNNIGFIIDDKQYNNKMELMDDGDVYTILYKILITRTKVKKWYIYKALNLDWELLHQFPVYDWLLKIKQDGSFIECVLGKKASKKLHIWWFKHLIEEAK